MISTLEIVTPADTQDLTVLATVKARLGLTGTSEDALLAALIHEASAAIARHCRRVFGSESLQQNFYLEGGRPDALTLARRPVSTITEITIDGAALDEADYLLAADTGMIYRLSAGAPICWSGSLIEVAFDAGYALLEELPFDIEQACIEMVRLAYFASGARARDPLLMAVSVPDVASETYQIGQRLDMQGGLPDDIAARLAPYREALA